MGARGPAEDLTGDDRGSRLSRIAANWVETAKALDVYLQYEFTGVSAAPRLFAASWSC